MSTKRVNPYTRLKEEFCEYVNKIEYAHTKLMFRYAKKDLGASWSLADLAERTAAADQLGYDVILKSTDAGLEVFYRKKAPSRPWSAQ